MPSKHSYPDLLRTNHYLQKAADSFYFQCTTRTVQESKLYPVNPYISLSYLQAWYRWPELLRKIDAAMPAEEIGDRARQVGSYVNTITMGLIPQFYPGGRQILMDMGMLKPTDALDDVMFVLDFGQRINMGYHRAANHIIPSDAGHRNQVHTARQTQAFEEGAIGVTPGDRLHHAFNKFMAALSAYGFLSHCECRLSFNNHGPYKLKNGNEMLVRDALDLAECDYPWMDGVASPVDHNNLTVTVVMKDTHFHMVDDWASFEATPSYDVDNQVAVGLYTSDFLSEGYIPIHMDNPSDLADYFEHLTEELEEATAGMWKMMAGWSRDQMIDAGLLVYFGVLKDLAHFAGVYEQDDWFKVEDRVQRFKPLFNDEYGGALIAEIVGLVSMSSQNRSPYHMAKFSGERGDMWTPIPYSVLADDEFTETVGPIRSGSTSLPEKTAKYTTTRGKLTQEECNRYAREFRSTAYDLRHYDDDTWVKFHPDDPKAAELEAAALGSSAAVAAH
jgi:hypothetical protein